MTKVGIAELKAKLSDYVRRARGGETVVVCDRDRPVADLVAHRAGHEPLEITPPTGKYRRIAAIPMPRLPRVPVDVVDVLLELRRNDR